MTAPSFFLTVSTNNFRTWTHINQTALAESDPSRRGTVESFLPCESIAATLKCIPIRSCSKVDNQSSVLSPPCLESSLNLIVGRQLVRQRRGTSPRCSRNRARCVHPQLQPASSLSGGRLVRA